MKDLSGKKGLVIGIANDSSIAWGCAKAFNDAGADIAVTYLNEKSEKYVRPLAEEIDSPIILPLDVTNEEQITKLFQEIGQQWGELDFILHSIAFAPKEDLHGRVIDCSKKGFLKAMEVSCYSFLQICQEAEALLKKGDTGGSILTVSYYGSQKVIPHYGVMGPVKAALECSVKYLADELGESGIRVNALSPGPLMTRAASGIKQFESLLEIAKEKSPKHKVVTIEDIGALARFLVSDDAKHITGNISYIDAGLNILGN
jgi:enoyl-[acyl-carrier protein] reductase I